MIAAIFFLLMTTTVSAQWSGTQLCSINNLEQISANSVEVTAQEIKAGDFFSAPVQYYSKQIVNDCMVYELCGEGFTATYTVCDKYKQLYLDNGCIVKLKNQTNE